MPAERKLLAVALAAILVGSAAGAGAMALVSPADRGTPPDATTDPDPVGEPTPTEGPDEDPRIEQFDSEAAFQEYVTRARERGGYAFTAGAGGADVAREAPTNAAGGDGGDAGGAPRATVTQAATRTVAETAGDGGDDGDSRYSDTNVQVEGIQEPDVLKSDGRTIYYGTRALRAHRDYGRDERRLGRTHVVDASSPGSPETIADVDDYGRMFLTGDTLVVLGSEAVTGYDVSDPDSPTRTWRESLNGRVAAARLLDGEMYLVLQEGVDVSDPCPVEPLGRDGPSVPCTDVYHPSGEASADVTYTTVRMDPDDGTVGDTVSVVGTRDHSATYVSEDAVYLTYTRRSSYTDLTMTYLLEEQEGVLDERARSRLRELQGYDLSERALRIEIRAVIENWLGRLDEQRRREVRERFEEGFRRYLEDNKRRLTTTGIVEVSVDGGMTVAASGEVPGYPIGQWALSQSGDTLRIATTVEGYGVESENDLYTLDGDLDRMGSVRGMSDGQRIYSVRYVGDTAYVVTFRQVDPFHVIDLSDPSNPEQLGKVRLPGFSRYLHPLSEDRVLGIGQEDGRVKATVFDVSTPSDPKVEESLRLDASYSAVGRNHRAFLIDRRYGVFFLPTERGGYVVGYEGGLSVERKVETRGAARRAMYIDDYMYVFGESALTVLNETDWSTAATLEFDRPGRERPPDLRVRADATGNGVTVRHAGGDAVDGENLELRCGGATVEVLDGVYRPGDRIVETERCAPGEAASLVWTAEDDDWTQVLDRFEVPGDR